MSCDICAWLDTVDLEPAPEWVTDVHGETPDVLTIEAAADHIEHRLEH